MSLEKLIALMKENPPKDPEGNEYFSKEIVGANNEGTHWKVLYTYKASYGWEYKSFWERMKQE